MIFTSLLNRIKNSAYYQAERQRAIIQIMTVLPGKYHYDAVESAIHAAGVHPEQIYMSLSANEHTLALARFYEALTGRHEL